MLREWRKRAKQGRERCRSRDKITQAKWKHSKIRSKKGIRENAEPCKADRRRENMKKKERRKTVPIEDRPRPVKRSCAMSRMVVVLRRTVGQRSKRHVNEGGAQATSRADSKSNKYRKWTNAGMCIRTCPQCRALI